MNITLKHKITGKLVIIKPVARLYGVHLYQYAFKVNDTLKPCFGDKQHADKTLHNEIERYLKFGYDFED